MALAAFGLLIGGVLMGGVALTAVLPFTVTFGTVDLFGGVPWWVPLLFVIVVSTAIAYAVSDHRERDPRIEAVVVRVGLLEVVAATF